MWVVCESSHINFSYIVVWNILYLFYFSYATPLDQQLPNSSNESDNYDRKPYSESEHSTASCCTSCKYSI